MRNLFAFLLVSLVAGAAAAASPFGSGPFPNATSAAAGTHQIGIGNKVCLDDDCTTYIFASANDVPALVANGVTRFNYTGATRVEGTSFIDEIPVRATPGSATASTVWVYAETQNSIVSICFKVGSTPFCIQPPQDVVNNTCTQGQFTMDTGGATVEECYCSATNTWRCQPTTTTNPTD